VSAFVTAAELRTYLDITSTTGRASSTNLDLMIQAASDFLERATGRIITASASNTSRTFSSDGRAAIAIPDLRTASSITLQGSTLTADSTYWLVPAKQQPGDGTTIYTGLQFRAYDTYDYRSNPEWFDRNLDSPYWSVRRYGLPNDLVITGLWGWTSVPAQWKIATLVLAGWNYKRPDSLLANVAITPEGNELQYGQMPPEVRELIDGWRLSDMVVTV
jgi:hypothetical protein